jgi:OmcA/MtrC family decaheme c-type cytochrome
MLTQTRIWLMAGLVGLLVACGGGGGGNSAKGVEPGPPPPGGSVPPPDPEFPETNPSPYAEAEELFVTIKSVTLDSSQRAIVEWLLTDGNNVPIIDLGSNDVRFTIAKLQGSPLGNLTGTWQSYINSIETPQAEGDAAIGTEPRLQATYERDEGEFQNLGDGNYRYHLAQSLTDLPQDELDQAAFEGLDLSYEPDRNHRVAMQFDNAPGKANPFYDWVPAGGSVSNMQIAATENCNRCHDPLAIHGGGRIEIEYCVTCHNAGSTDADSTNTVDMKVMIHKIHHGANLTNLPYAIYGFRDSEHDYSTLVYPQDIRNCRNCHMGTNTDNGDEEILITNEGDNWAEVPSQAACGSCHDDVDFSMHQGGQEDDLNCAQCHTSGWTQSAHVVPVDEARKAYAAEIENVENTMPGENAVVTFRITNPLTGEDYDIMNDPVFTGSGARLAVGVAWDTGDYNNAGNEGNNASQVQADALADASPNGDGSYTITMPVAIPDGSKAPNIPASGSGVATVEGHPVEDVDGDGELDSVPVGDEVEFFSIDEPDGEAVERRPVVDIDNCQDCHQTLVLHGNNRADNIDSCVSCHNPRNTDRRVREQGKDPDSGGSAMATDGKDEESIDFKTMVHGIHAAGIRENALQVVGFMAFNLHVYDEEHVHYPGNLANCTACHTEDGYKLPLASSVLGTSNDTGEDVQDPTDDTVTTPATAVCSSCHDDAVATAHMTENGGSFSTTQQAIDEGEVVEQCEICHGEGRSAAVEIVHDPH